MAISVSLPLVSRLPASLHCGAEVQTIKCELGRNTRRNPLVKSFNTTFNGSRLPVVPSINLARRGVPVETWAMAKREDQVASLRQMSNESIEEKVLELKGELFVLRCKQATRQDYKSSDFRKLRKEIARMLTIRREREIEKGIRKRESRKLDREWKKNIVVKPAPSLASLGS